MKEHETVLKEVCGIVHQKALDLKKNEQASEIISWRYNLRLSQVKNWLIETNWNYTNSINLSDFEQVVAYLRELQLISAKESENWKQKLFM